MRLRKMNYLSLLALIVVLNFNCSSNKTDDEDQINSDERAELIIGTWRLTKAETDQGIDKNHDEEYNTNLLAFEMEDCEIDDDYIFTSGNENLFYRNDDHISGTTCHPDGISYIEFEYYWELSEDQESLLFDTDLDGTTDSTLEIISFTNNEIELKEQEENTLEDDSVALVTFTYVFERV